MRFVATVMDITGQITARTSWKTSLVNSNLGFSSYGLDERWGFTLTITHQSREFLARTTDEFPLSRGKNVGSHHREYKRIRSDYEEYERIKKLSAGCRVPDVRLLW